MGYDAVEVERSAEFVEWLLALPDSAGRVAIERRLQRMVIGNIGDYRGVGDGICELRIHQGPGYRVYFSRCGRRLVVLLCGGDKSTQRSDIERARRIRRSYPWH